MDFLSPILNGVTSLVGSLFNYNAQKQTNKTQVQMMREQNAFQERMINAQNVYNSFSNQRQLMEDAGLNPAFLFGNGSVDATQPSAPTGAAAPTLQAPQLDIQTPSRMLFEAKRLQNETMSTEANIDKLIAESESYKVATRQAEESFDLRMKQIEADTTLKGAQKDEAIARVKTEKAKQLELYRNAENLKYNARLLQQKAISEKWSHKKMSKEIDRLIKLTPIEAKELESRYHVNESQASVFAATLNKVQQEVTTMIKQGRLIDAQAMSQIMDNAVKELKTDNEIERLMMRDDSPVLNMMLDETNGWIGDIIGFASSLAIGATSNDTKGSLDSKRRRYLMDRNNSSWYFE